MMNDYDRRSSRELTEAMVRLRTTVKEEEPHVTMHLTRPEALVEAIDEMDDYLTPAACLHALRVNFIDAGGTSEASIDNGGPSREFGCLFSQQLRTSGQYMNGMLRFQFSIQQ